jgi:hypothetical protein
MAIASDPGDVKTVNVDRGLFLVEYESADDGAFPPEVAVAAAPGHEGRVDIITHPDGDGRTLWRPDTALVVRALEPAVLRVTVQPSRPSGSRTAAVKIVPIGQGAQQGAALDLDQVQLLGHVAGIGDVRVALGEWIGGPHAPSRIEGLALQWPQLPQGLELRYAVKAGGGQMPAGKMAVSGEYVGTRGRALPLTGLMVELSGPRSRDHELAVDAIFLSQPAMRANGKRLVLSGPTGREPLVGLRLALQPVAAQALPAASEPARAEPAPAIEQTRPSAARAPQPGRVRVFRSGARQGGT